SHIEVQVGEADSEGIDLGMSFGEQDADIFGIVPSERFGHGRVPYCSFKFPVSSFRNRNVRHPNIAENLETGNCFLVMFFRYVIAVPGGDLDHYLTRLCDLHLAAET